MRPAWRASYPASTAFRIARAIAGGSAAREIALASSTASQPASIASAASDAVPTPASRITGTRACSTISRRLYGLLIPMPLPIGEPSGITAAQPASSRRRARIGSSFVYGRMVKPSATSSSAAESSSPGSGNRVRSSPITSSFTQSVSSASRASLAVVTASRAVKQPAVFGSTSSPASSSTSTIEPRALGSTRRIATVANSAPDSRAASAISWRLRKPPVPRIRRDSSGRPAISNTLTLLPAPRAGPRAPGPRAARSWSTRRAAPPHRRAPRPRRARPWGRRQAAPRPQPWPRPGAHAAPRSARRRSCAHTTQRASAAREARWTEGRELIRQRVARQQAGHQLACDRSEQHAVTPVARGPNEAVELARPHDRRVIRRAWAQPGAGTHELQLADLREHLPGSLEQPEHAVGRHGRVEALLLHRRAEDNPPVAARDEIAARGAQQALEGLGHGGARVQLEDLSLHRPYGRALAAGVEGRAPRPCCHHHLLARNRAGAGADAAHRRALPFDGLDLHAESDLLCRRGQGRHRRARVGVAVLRRQNSARDARRQPRLEAAAARRREPLRGQPERALEVVQAAERLGVVAVGRHHEGAAVAVAGRQAGDLLELGGERRPALAPREVHPQRPLLAEVGLRHGGEHPGRHTGCPGVQPVGAVH